MINKEIKLLYLMELFAGLARGSYLGCIGWTTLVLSNSVATVGQIFIMQSVTIMLTGPIIGILIDRAQRKTLIIQAQAIITAIMLGISALLLFVPGFSILWLFGAVVFISSARLMYQGAFDCVIKAAVKHENILSTVARGKSIHLAATATGMAGIGLIIDRFSTGHAFVASASASIVVVVIAFSLATGRAKSNARGWSGYWLDFMGGLAIFRHNRQIQMLALLTAVALPVGQLTNAVLSSFIRDDLGKGSDVFGTVDAGWAIGGMLAALLLSKKIKNIDSPYSEYIIALLAGAATIGFSYCTEVKSLFIMHGLMGLFVWLCRIMIAARVIQFCKQENVGRTRVYIEVMFGFSALMMCLSPTLIVLDATANYFTYWGVFIVVCSLLLMVGKARQLNHGH